VNAQLDIFDRQLPELEKARAERRSNFAQDISDGLLVDVPMSRTDHPDTSHEAGEWLHRSGGRASMQKAILEHVRKYPGCIYLEIAAALGIERHNVASRLAEMKGVLVRQGEKRELELGGKRLHYLTWWPT